VVPLSPCWFVVAIAPIAAPGLAVAAPPRVEIGPPAEGFEGWAVAGVVVGEIAGDGCRLTVVHRPSDGRPARAVRTGAFSRDRCVAAPADRERAVLAGDGQVVVGVDTCTDVTDRIAGVRLTVARVAAGALVPARARPSWIAAGCARWHRGAPCPVGHAVFAFTSPTAAVLTGPLAVRCVPFAPGDP